MAGTRTLGVEEEFQVVDDTSMRLAPRAPQLLARLPDEGFAAELQRSTVETNTAVCGSLDELRREVLRLRATLIEAAGELGLAVAAAGASPLSVTADLEVTARGRYGRMQQDYRLLVDEHLVCGLQVHVGVDDPDVAVRLMPRIEGALSVLLALSASSPFFEGQDTGYSSVRAVTWQRWPTAGRAPRVSSYASYGELIESLITTKVISDAKMAYFDVRPSAHVPTLELRVCDSCPMTDDVVLIAGLFRAVVEQAALAEQTGEPAVVRAGPLYRAAMWRAARSGLSDTLLDAGDAPVARPAGEVVIDLVDRLRPQLEDAGDWEVVSELATAAVARGTSSERQRARYAERGRVADVVELLVEETSGREATHSTRTRWSSGYPPAPDDEAVHQTGTPYPSYQPVFDVLDRFDRTELIGRTDRLRKRIVGQGLTFGVDGEQRPFPVDPVPRVIPAHEWAVLTAGLTQRARAIEAYLRDVYGPAEVLRDGVIDRDMLLRCGGWRPEAAGLPPDVVRAPIIGFDLVRDSIGGWRVLEDNVRVPSGIGYAIAVRRLMRSVMPEMTDVVEMRDAEDALALIGRTLRGCSTAPDPEVALLSDGADNSGWYEHRLIAEEVGLLLAQPGEVEIRNRQATVGGRTVDVFYLRLEGELADLTDAGGRRIGAAILELAQEGRVVVVNAPGNGIADDKAMYCDVPDLITYYLGERTLLNPVPTYRCSDPVELALVVDRLDQLVTKPVGGHGGHGVLIGPEADRAELEGRRREIIEDPAGWVAQEVVALSTLPTLVNGRLEPRHVDLRVFVYQTGTEPGKADLAGLALTRAAPGGSMVVNSSRGGGAKDTWILVDPDRSGERSMCGLVGEIRFDGRPADVAALDRSCAVMAARGPDGSGIWALGPVGLGHRRLSIIDLSAAGSQPMVDPAAGLTIAFNGCIYNYQSLRAELGHLGHTFFSHSDTEVVAKAYAQWGPGCVAHFHGMFAFAIAEHRAGRLVLGRDRLGIKPLYITADAERLRFASTLPALLAAGGVDTSIDRTALAQYMTFHSVVPPPRTILQGVRKLPPATVRTVEPDGSTSDLVYWDPSFSRDPGRADWTAVDWQQALVDALRTAVKRRQVADVDVGVLLSGGIDSSLVVALLAEAGQQGLKTFSVGFDDAGGESGNEFEYSDLVAAHFGTEHHRIKIDSARLLPAIDGAIGAMSEPMVSHDCVAFYLLSEEVSRQVKVVQSGQGADEVLGGYDWYPPLAGVRRGDAVEAYSEVFFDRRFAELRGLLQHDWLLTDDAPTAFIQERFGHPGAETTVDAALRNDTTVMLVDDPVKRVDNMTMAWGLEARVPFLDHELVELAGRIPPELKLADGGKGVLKAGSRGLVPDEVIDRTKGYFPVPAIRQLEGPYLTRVRDALTDPAARARGLFVPATVEHMLDAPNEARTTLGSNALWQLALLEMWLQAMGVPAT